VLVVTATRRDEVLLALFRLGIAGFAPKTSKSAIIEAGDPAGAWRADVICRRALSSWRRGKARLAMARRRPFRPCGSPNGRSDVLKLIATGQSNKEIARDLDLSPATIKPTPRPPSPAWARSTAPIAVVKARGMGPDLVEIVFPGAAAFAPTPARPRRRWSRPASPPQLRSGPAPEQRRRRAEGELADEQASW